MFKETTKKGEKPREEQKREDFATSKARGLRLRWNASYYRAGVMEGHSMGAAVVEGHSLPEGAKAQALSKERAGDTMPQLSLLLPISISVGQIPLQTSWEGSQIGKSRVWMGVSGESPAH